MKPLDYHCSVRICSDLLRLLKQPKHSKALVEGLLGDIFALVYAHILSGMLSRGTLVDNNPLYASLLPLPCLSHR